MGLLDRLRDLLSGPPRVQVSRAEEGAEREEYGLGDRGETELHDAEERAELAGGGAVGGVGAGFGAEEAGETAEADLDTMRPPRDAAP